MVQLRMKSIRLALAATALLLPSIAAHAQIAAYASFEGEQTYSKWYKGGTFGIYDDFYSFGPLRLGADLRGSILSGSNSNTSTRVLAGFRAAVKPPILPIKPYAEILGGVSKTDINNLPGGNHAVAEANGGVDFTFLPHLDWRIVEVGGTVAQKGTDDNFHVSTGIVLRFF